MSVELRYTLSYYDNLFGGRTAAWAELVRALADELDDYAAEVTAAAASGLGLAEIRHSHRPSLQNLGSPLPEPDEGLDPAGAETFAGALRNLADRLRSEVRRST